MIDFTKYDLIEKDHIASGMNRFEAQKLARAAFFADVKTELRIEDNPKADKMLNVAWDIGHSAGYHDVYYEALDLVELIR